MIIKFIFKKVLYGVSVLWGVCTLLFLLFFLMPDAEELTAGQRTDVVGKEAMKKAMGLDKPAFVRYCSYLNDLSPVSIYTSGAKTDFNYWEIIKTDTKKLVFKMPYLRRSYQNGKPVSTMLFEAFEGTLVLAISAMLLAVLFGIPAGVVAAWRFGKWQDTVLSGIAHLGISVPSFFMAIVIAWLLGFVLHRYTGLSMTGSLQEIDPATGEKLYKWRNLVLPCIALGIRPLAIIVQLTRSSMLDVLQQDYIRTARAKGLSETKVLYRHALKNALNPVVTAVSGWFASLLAGAFFIEYVFNWKGLGKVAIDALQMADLPVVMGAVLMASSLFILINIVVDILYTKLDPRITIS